MNSKILLDNAILETTLFIADNGANLQNESVKLNNKNYISISEPVEMLFLSSEIQDLTNRDSIMEMLDKLIAACIINKVQTQLVELISNSDYSLNMELSDYAKRIFIFGINPDELHLHTMLEKYQIANWAKSKIIYCDSLEALLSDKKSKGLLWAILKQEFNIL